MMYAPEANRNAGPIPSTNAMILNETAARVRMANPNRLINDKRCGTGKLEIGILPRNKIAMIARSNMRLAIAIKEDGVSVFIICVPNE